MGNRVEKTVEWELGFHLDEVIAGLEKLLTEAGYRIKREKTDAREQVFAPLSQPGSYLLLEVCPLPARRLSAVIFLPRTLLSVRFTGATSEEEGDFMRRLTMAFLRVGG